MVRGASFLLFSAAALSFCSYATPLPKRAAGTVSMPFRKVKRDRGLAKRDNTITASLSNDEFLYLIDVGVGTPPQAISLQIDTGSSDVWTFSPAACSSVSCVGGSYDESQSSTYSLITSGGFDITYGDNSHVTGDLISDNLQINGATITALEMGYSTAASGNVAEGIMGVGLDTNEANDLGYPSIIDDLVSQGLISAGAYSLWLDDLEAGTGTILFGGYDSSHYSGELATLPFLAVNGATNQFVVEFTSIGITDSTGSTTLTDSSFDAAGLMDSGTTLIHVPTDIYTPLATYFGANSDGTIDCGFANTEGSLDFGFPGVTISVPFSELVLPDSADGVCLFGLAADDQEPFAIFGDTFLRSAYVVYDLDNLELGLAQTVFA